MENRNHIKRYSIQDTHKFLAEKYGERYKKYRELWELTDKGEITPEKPLYFFIELNSHCNLNCKMCYQSLTSTKRPVYSMPMHIVDKMAKEIKELEIPSMILSAGAEGLIHPEIKEIITKFKNAGIIDFILMTNGIKLTEDIAELIVDLGIERLSVSLDAATPQTYEKIRGIDKLELIKKNINKFLEIRKKKNSKLPFLRLTFVKQEENFAEIDAFYEKWKDKADLIDYQDLINYANVDELKQIDCEHFVCSNPFQRIGVGYNGDIYPCCSFYQKYFVLGNIEDTTLLEAWNSPKINILRRAFRDKLEIPLPCKNCYGNLNFR